MSSPERALQEAVYARLAGDPVLVELLGGASIYDGAPRNAAPPFVHFGETTIRDWSTGTETGAEVGFAMAVWSRAEGRSEALRIADQVRALLHDTAPALEGWRVVNLRHLGTETARLEKPEGRRAVVRFRARLEVFQ